MKLAVVVLALALLSVAALEMEDVKPLQRRSKRALVSPTIAPGKFLKKKHIVIVPKGDPRARPPAGADGLVPPPAGDCSTLWSSQATWLPPLTPAAPVVAAGPAGPAARPTLQATAGGYCANGVVNLRDTPTTKGKVLFATTNGEAVRVTATTEKSANGYVWVPVNVRSRAGWMAKSLLKSCGTTTPPRPPTTTPTTPTTPVAGSAPMMKQCGGNVWASNKLGTCKWTICEKGCAISSVSMYLKKLGANVDPGALNTYLTNNGGYANGCDIYWGKADGYGKTSCQGFQTGNYATVCGWVRNGWGVILNVKQGGHWVLATGCDGGSRVLVNDPGYALSSYAFSEVGRMVVYKPK